MACQFCATGREGLTRNLTAAEIIAQVALVQEDFQERVSNVVVMGQGEPFLNYDEVLAALRILNSRDDFNIGARHITLSTCGIIDGIDRLSQEPEQFTLAVSLHSALQKKRDRLMPKVAKQPLSDLKKAVERYTQSTNRLPVNTVEGSPLQAASPATAKHWVETLIHYGVETSFRKSRGADIDGACGQLKNKLAQGSLR